MGPQRHHQPTPVLSAVSGSPDRLAADGADLAGVTPVGAKPSSPLLPAAPVDDGAGVRVTIESTIEAARVDAFYELYLAAFAPLRTRAVGRQVLTYEEFVVEMADPRVWKYVAWDDQGEPQALATLTRTLATVPWISPEYFAALYPEHTARNAVYYLGFVLTRPGHRGHTVLLGILSAVIDQLALDRAVCGFDICLFNNATIHFDRRLETLTRRLAGATTATIDTQTYYSTTFP